MTVKAVLHIQTYHFVERMFTLLNSIQAIEYIEKEFQFLLFAFLSLFVSYKPQKFKH